MSWSIGKRPLPPDADPTEEAVPLLLAMNRRQGAALFFVVAV
jgi:hypothetical protein